MPLIRLYPSGRTIACDADESVLSALEHAGYAQPVGCHAGFCGECKTHVRSGEYELGHVLSSALRPEERDAGWALLCMTVVTGDEIEIDHGNADAQPIPVLPRRDVPYIVVDKVARTRSIVELRLSPVASPLRFWPGQHVLLGDPGNGVPPRPYSMANAPDADGDLTLMVTRVPGGVTSNWIHDVLAPGARVKLSGPYGRPLDDPSVELPIVCFARDVGLAPIVSLCSSALRRGFPHPVTLVFSSTGEEDLFDRGRMALWEARVPNFRYVPVVGGGLADRIPELFPDLSQHTVVVAGLAEFAEPVIAAARAAGAIDRHIHAAVFVPASSDETRTPEPDDWDDPDSLLPR